mgnify:CR=1 FL=1
MEYPGSLLRANQVEVQYRDRDIMCIEQLTVTEGNYRIDLIQDWDKRAFDVEKYAYKNSKPPWKSGTGRKISFWSTSCSPDERQMTQLEPFIPKCHNNIFLQHDHMRSRKLAASRISYQLYKTRIFIGHFFI